MATDIVKTQKTLKEHAWDTFIALLQAAFMAMVIYNFAFQLSKVQGACMLPLLQDNDRVFVNKYVYRFEDIKRGDIVVFKAPQKPEVDYIKRVIGLPGDTIEVKRGQIYINGELYDEEYVKELMRKYPMTYADTPYTVPEDHYFVMGDNRNNSNDSRFWGPVPKAYIRGKAIFNFWPPNRIKLF